MQIIDWIFILLIFVGSMGLLLSRRWRSSVIFLAIQYVGVFCIITQIWPIYLAIIKLISGLVVCLVLLTTQSGSSSYSNPESSWPEGRLFRIFASGLILITTLAITPLTSKWLGLENRSGIFTGLFLMCLGLLQLGITIRPIRVIIALLTILSGFEIMYAFVETSSLVATILVAINLGLALVGIYLINPSIQETSR